MIKGKKVLAVIPARGGSKRLPEKNIVDFLGKPMIAWTIESALNSKYIDRVIVSTDSNDISSISKQYGANVPFIRPSDLSNDDSKSVDVALHAINALKVQGDCYDFVILLQPTSPYRNSSHIDGAIQIVISNNANSVISVTKAKHSPLWMNTIPKNGSMDGFIHKSIANKRSQDLPVYYQLNGAIYLCNVKNLVEERTFFTKEKSFSFQMDFKSSVDIDDEYDLLFASLINKIGSR